MQIDLTAKEFRRLLDLVYIGNWVLNSTRGEDRFADYDNPGVQRHARIVISYEFPDGSQ